MTAELSITNGQQAVVVTDSQSLAGRASNEHNKLCPVESTNYHGFIFGSGDGYRINALYYSAREIAAKCADIQNFADNLSGIHAANIGQGQQQGVKATLQRIQMKSTLIENPEQRQRFLDSEMNRALMDFDEYEKNDSGTQFGISVYDKTQKRIRNLLLNNKFVMHYTGAHLEIGSGRDAANWYFVSKLQGLDMEKAKPNDLMFFALNAYNLSTLNEGVGGMPKVGVIDDNGTAILDVNMATALCNLSALYLAETPGLTREFTRELMQGILEGEEYKSIARDAKIPVSTLTDRLIPYSSAQESMNRSFLE